MHAEELIGAQLQRVHGILIHRNGIAVIKKHADPAGIDTVDQIHDLGHGLRAVVFNGELDALLLAERNDLFEILVGLIHALLRKLPDEIRVGEGIADHNERPQKVGAQHICNIEHVTQMLKARAARINGDI